MNIPVAPGYNSQPQAQVHIVEGDPVLSTFERCLIAAACFLTSLASIIFIVVVVKVWLALYELQANLEQLSNVWGK